jgi:hypothetical protein
MAWIESFHPQNKSINRGVCVTGAYAPSVPASLRRRLALAFADLRGLYAEGLLQYPYSIRYVVWKSIDVCITFCIYIHVTHVVVLAFADLRGLYAEGLLQYPYSIRYVTIFVCLCLSVVVVPKDGNVSTYTSLNYYSSLSLSRQGGCGDDQASAELSRGRGRGGIAECNGVWRIRPTLETDACTRVSTTRVGSFLKFYQYNTHTYIHTCIGMSIYMCIEECGGLWCLRPSSETDACTCVSTTRVGNVGLLLYL